MFERFTKGARAAVTGAVTHAERAEADSVTEEHLLLSLLDQKGSRASFAVAALGLTDRRDSMESALAEARRRGGLTEADTAALAGIGIDITEILARVEGVHGEGALAAARGTGAGGPVGGPSRAAPRASWRSPCASRSAGATASSARSTFCWP